MTHRLRLLIEAHRAYLLLQRDQPPHQHLMTPLVLDLPTGGTPHDAITTHMSALGLSANHAAVPRLMGTVHLTCTDGREWTASYFQLMADRQPEPTHPEGTLEWLLAENVPNVPMPHLDWIAIKTLRKATAEALPFRWRATVDLDERLIQLCDTATEATLYQRRQR